MEAMGALGRGVRRWWRAVGAIVVAALVVTACGTTTATGPTSTTGGRGSAAPSTSTTTVPDRVAVSLYWVRNGESLGVSHRSIPTTPKIATAAIEALLQGPNGAEATAGLSSSIPGGSRLLGLSITGGVATANFNSTFASGGGTFSTQARIAEVVFTLTQFSSVQRVAFELDGVLVKVFGSEGLVLDHPLSRSDEFTMLPPIFLESPAVGDTVTSPLRISGLSNTFEATFVVELVDAVGHVVVNQPVTATAGTGTWGTFDASYSFVGATAGTGKVVVFEISAKDGTRINEVQVPVQIR